MTKFLYGLFTYNGSGRVLLSKNPCPEGLNRYCQVSDGVHPSNTGVWQRVTHKELIEW